MVSSPFLLILGIISGLWALSWVWKLVYSFWRRPVVVVERFLHDQGITGLPYRFPFGNLQEFFTSMKEEMATPMNTSHQIAPRVLPFLHRMVNNYGKISVTWEGRTPKVTVMDHELVREVFLNKCGYFEKPESHPILKQFVSGFATYNGEKWAKHRRIITPAFHLEKLKRMLPAFSFSCSELISKWEKLVPYDGSCELDVWPELQNLTADVISRTAFGSSYKEGMRIFQLQKEQAELYIRSYLGQYIPGYRFLPTGKNIRRNKIAKEVRALLRSIIEKRQKVMKMGDAKNDDLLGLLMESNLKYALEQGDSKDTGMTIEDVIEESKLFYFAGQETTSVLLTWTMVALSMHPVWQDRAREEVLKVFGKDKPDFDGLSNLKIVTMILYEVLRLYPPVVFVIRFTFEEVRLGRFKLPPGVLLCLPTLLIHHDQELWGKDADEFNPERFTGGVSNATKNQFSFFPFGWGPRVCIGQNFAMMEAKLALAMILQRFSFELSPTYAHAPCMIITLNPQHGAQIILHKL